MKIKVLAGALIVALGSADSARAEAAGQIAAEPAVPTVTIINKAGDDAAATEPNAVSIVEETEAEGVLPARSGATPDADADAAEAASDDASDETAEAAKPAPPPSPTLHIDIDLTRQVMTVSNVGGSILHTWPVSSGRQGYRTPTGTFKPTWMARQWFSRQYDNAPMPHSIFFHQGVAIHGSWATRSLGRPASHGCVRLAPKNARTLFSLVTRHGKERTQIVVHGAPNFRSAPAMAAGERLPRASQARRSPAYS